MRTIASEVTNYIKTKPFLSTALSQGIINLTSLARVIKPNIEKGLRKPAKSGAIVMALKRISDSLEFVSTHKIIGVLKNLGDITVRSSLVDYSFLISESKIIKNDELYMLELKYVMKTSSNEINTSIQNHCITFYSNFSWFLLKNS